MDGLEVGMEMASYIRCEGREQTWELENAE